MVPSYVIDERLPRNSAGTLLHAAELCAEDDFIVFCDPDLLFVRKVTFPSLSFRKLLFLSRTIGSLRSRPRSRIWACNAKYSATKIRNYYAAEFLTSSLLKYARPPGGGMAGGRGRVSLSADSVRCGWTLCMPLGWRH